MQFSVLKNTAPTFSTVRTDSIFFRLFFLSLTAIWIFGFLSPVITKFIDPFIHFLFSRTYSRICHQDIEKCISVGGESMLVCARCAGIYIGAFLATILNVFTRIPILTLKLIIIFSLPLILDVSFTFSGLYSYSQLIAFITGLSFGSAITFVILAEVKQLISKKIKTNNE